MNIVLKTPAVEQRTSPAVMKALCEPCKDNLTEWMAGNEDLAPFNGCSTCVQRVIDTVLSAGSIIEVARDLLIYYGALVNTPFGIEIPSVADEILLHATKRHPGVRRTILRIVAAYGTTALIENVWITSQRFSGLKKRIPHYTREVAEQLLLPNEKDFIAQYFPKV